MPLPVSDKYLPLYLTQKPIILITGGRGSGKSFNASLFCKRLLYERNQIILYSRYTMVSAEKSVIPEFKEKIEIEGDNEYFNVNQNNIVNNITGSRIMFDGIKTSSGNQTAKLKSIQGLTTFVVDEGEEWQSEEEYDKIRLSIRTKGVQNRTLIIMNPCSNLHFIYKKYLRDTHRIEIIDGVEVQISTHPDVEHIHTTYLDNLENLSAEFLSEIADIKQSSPKKYAEIVIGRWGDGSELNSLYDTDMINSMFSNHITKIDRKYIVCDAARYGKDLCVTMVFRGWEVIHTSILTKSDVHDVVKDIESLRKKFGVPTANTLVDGDGIGGDTVRMGGYKSFHGGSHPRKIQGILENYRNLKTQCAFYLAEKHVNIGEILLHINNQTVSVDGVYGTKIKMGSRMLDVRDLIIEDFRAIRYVNAGTDGKKEINPKDEQKELIGRSPDFFDCCNMRCFFELFPKSQYL